MMPQLSWIHLAALVVISAPIPWLPHAAWPWWRLVCGAAWLAWGDPRALGFLAVATLVVRHAPPIRWLGWAVVGLTFLAARVGSRLGWTELAPLGFGFALLRLAHYWEDRCSGRIRDDHGVVELFGWLTYLPTVLTGPVQRFEAWLRWEQRRRWSDADAAEGLRRILYGYVKVLVLGYLVWGEHVGVWLTEHVPRIATGLVPLGITYFSLSGFSDVAIGTGRIWGQTLPENFDAPFTKATLPEFWRSWHMTVSGWCRDYVFVPILARTRRASLAAGAAIAVFALWHELSLAYLCWGLWHALGLLLWRRFLPAPTGWMRWVSRVLTWAWVVASFCGLYAWPKGMAWYAR